MSSFDKDFGRQFEPVEQTMVLGEIASKLMERYAPGDPEVAQEHRLRIIDPNGEEWEYPVHSEVMIGRAPDNHITLNDRSVSRHHVALNTDGTLYWFQDLKSGNGTQVNNEFMQEGWLTGGEEIVIGNSRLYFLLPDVDAPPELVTAMGESEASEVPEEEAAQEEEFELSQQEHNEDSRIELAMDASGGARWIVAFVLFVGLIGASLAGLWIYRKNRKKKEENNSNKTVEKTPIQKAIALLSDGEKMLEKRKWLRADQMFRQAASMLPEGDKLRSTILARAKVASQEIKAASDYKRAYRLYRYNRLNSYSYDKTKKALQLIRRIPKTSAVYSKASRLLSLFRHNELEPRLKIASLHLAAQKKEKALAEVKKILVLDPFYTKARVMLKKLNTQNKVVPPRVAPRRRYRRTSNASLSTGLRYYRRGQITKSIIFFRRQESAARSHWTRRKAQRYRRYAQAYQRGWSRGRGAARRGRTSRAITHLLRAYRADRALGGNQHSKMSRLLSDLYYRRGQRRRRRGQYSRAARDFKNSTRYNSRNTKAYLALKSLRKKAKALMEEGEVLIGVSNSEARKKIQQAKRLLSPSDPLYRKANRLLGRVQ